MNITKDLEDPKVLRVLRVLKVLKDLKDLKDLKVFEKKREALKNQGLSFFYSIFNFSFASIYLTTNFFPLRM